MKTIVVAAGAVILKDKKILLTKRSSTKKLFPDYWCCPAGVFEDSDDSLEQTCIREVKEEVGLDFKPYAKLNFYETILEKSIGVSHMYLGEWSGDVACNESEVSDFGWFTYDDAMKLDLAFKFRDVIMDLFDNKLID